MTNIAKDIGVSRQALYNAYNKDKKVNGYEIVFVGDKAKPIRLTKQQYIDQSRELLRRARLIIADQNDFIVNNGEYASIGIVEDIDRFLKRGRQ